MPPKKTTRTTAKKTTAAASSAAKKAPAKPRAKSSKTAAAALSPKKAAAADFTIAGHKFLLSPPFLGLKQREKLMATITQCGGSVTKSANLAHFVVTQKGAGAYSDTGKGAVQAGAVRVSMQDFYKAVGRWGMETGIPRADFTGIMGQLPEKDLARLSSDTVTCTAENTKVFFIASGLPVIHSDAHQPPLTIVADFRLNLMIASHVPAGNDYTEILGNRITEKSVRF